MANQGQAASYYNDQSQPDRNQYAPPQDGQKYSQAPPNYGQSYDQNYSEKPTFDQAFKIDRPKWNDIWAGILFLIVCGGFVAVSGISIQGYGMYHLHRRKKCD